MVEESENPDLQIQAEERVDDGSSLDSFFKKKDKKGKKKKKTKVEKNVDDVGEILKVKKKESDNKKEKESQKDEANEEQEEWIDFEDESQRDYSDLKIQKFQINDGNEMPPDAPEYNEDGELLPPKPEDSPWKAVTTQDSVPATPQEPIKEAPVIEAPKKSTAYRPPQARMSSTGGSSDLTPISMKKTRKQLQQAPEISNELDFPSLAAASNDTVDGNEMPPDAPEYNEDGELLPPKPEDSPWKAVTTQDSVPATPQEPIKEAPVIEAPKKSTAYRPPQARMSSTGGSSDLTPISMKKTRKQLQQAPEISNELDFPSLAAASNDTVQHRGFEMVKVGVKSSASWRSNQQQNKSTGIELGNQFSALNTQ